MSSPIRNTEMQLEDNKMRLSAYDAEDYYNPTMLQEFMDNNPDFDWNGYIFHWMGHCFRVKKELKGNGIRIEGKTGRQIYYVDPSHVCDFCFVALRNILKNSYLGTHFENLLFKGI